MKHCTNCGSPIADDAIFCENCGAKQDATANETTNTQNQKNISTVSSSKNVSTKNPVRTYLIIGIALALLIFTVLFTVKSCSSSPESLEDVAREFTEALVIDFNAKKAVSLMSQELIDSYMDDMGFSSERDLINSLNESLEVREDDTIGYYGDDWRAKVIEVEIEKQKDDTAIVVVSVSHEGSDALWNTNIDDWRIYLEKENEGWRVSNFQG